MTAVVALVVSCLFGALMAAQAGAIGYYPYGSWPSVQTLTEPRDVVYAQDGEFFVADAKARQISVFSAETGEFLRAFDGSDKADGNLQTPVALAIGPSDALLYVADFDRDRIAVFNRTTGELVRTLSPGLSGPTDLEFGNSGNLYVADSFNNRVRVLTSNGAVVRDITGTGTSLLQLPQGVSLSTRTGAQEEAYVAETNRIRVYNATTGVWARDWGISTAAPYTSRYSALAGIEVVDVSGSNPWVYVIDRGIIPYSRAYSIIEKCTWSGSTSITHSGFNAFKSPEGLGVFGTWFLMADTGNARILKTKIATPSEQSVLAPTGDAAAALMQPVGVAPSADGGYYVADAKAKRLLKYDESGSLVTSFTPSSPTSSAPAGIAVSQDGSEVYVSEPSSGTVQVYGPTGSHVRTLTGFTKPVAVAVRPDGSLAVADEAKKQILFVLATGGSAGTTLSVAGTPSGVAVSAAGTVYVSDTDGLGRIRAYIGAVEVTRVAEQGTSAGFVRSPAGLALTADGDLIVADRGNNRIQRIDLDGPAGALEFGGLGSARGSLMAPVAVAASPDARVRIADTGNGRAVQARLDSSEPVTAYFGDVNVAVSYPVTVTLSATDEGSGPGVTKFRLNGGAEQIYTEPIVISIEGTTSVAFWSVDRVGNTESAGQMVYAKVDLTPPVGDTYFQDSAVFYRKPGTTRIVSEYSGATQMRLGTVANPGLYWLDITRDATITVTLEGATSLLAEYRDQAGNIVSRTFDCVIDGTGPTTPVSIAGDLATLGLHGNTLVQALPVLPGGGPTYTGAVSISLPATDPLSPIAHTYYRLDGLPEQEYAGPIEVSASGTHTVEAWALDAAGNLGGHTFRTFGISRLAGPGVLTVSDGSGDSSVTTVPWRADVQDAVKVNWDAGSGFAAQDFDYDPMASWEATVPAVEGDYPLSVRFKDPIGVIVDLVGTITYDRTGPETVIGLTKVWPQWASARTIVSITSVDPRPASDGNPSGVSVTKYRLDGGIETTVTGPLLVSADGSHTVEAWAIDQAGNAGASASRTFTVSNLPDGGDLSADNGASFFATTTVGMFTDIKSALRMRWTTGSGWSAPADPATWPGFTASFDATFSGDGPKVVTAEFVDQYSQVNTLTAPIVIDRSGPTMTLSRTPVETESAGPVVVSMTATDTYSPINRKEFTVVTGGTRGSVLTYTTPRTFIAEGDYTIEASATDAADNRGPVASTHFIITNLKRGGVVTIAGGAERTGRNLVSATVSAQSATQMCWSTGGAFTSWVPYTTQPFSATLTGQGEQTLTVRLKDRFGVEIELQDTIILDTSPPVTRFEGLPPSGVAVGPALLHFTATDLSPIAYTQFRLDDGTWTTYVAPVLITSGSHTVSYRSCDVFGYLENPAKTSTFTVNAASPSGTIRLNGGSSFISTTTVDVALNVPDAVSVRFNTGEGWSEVASYGASARLTLPSDGFYWVQAAVSTSTGVEATLSAPVVVDTVAPTLSAFSLSVRSFRPWGAAYRYNILMSAKAADAPPLSSSLASWRWTAGPYAVRTAGTGAVYGLLTTTHYPTVSVWDRAGNKGTATGRIKFGSAAPSVPSSAYAYRYFAVRGSVPVVGTGAAYRIWCYQRASNGVWYLKKTVVVSASVSGSWARISRNIQLGRGTWRVVLSTYKGAYLNASTPSRYVTVK